MRKDPFNDPFFTDPDYMDKQFSKARSRHKLFLVLIILAAVLGISIHFGTMAYKKSTHGHAYLITTTTYGQTDTDVSDTIYSQDSRCIVYRSTLGFKKSVCADNISVTEY